MSEVLRAILDANCVDSRTAFYSVNSVFIATGGGTTLARRQQRIACKSDVFFLVMGATQDICGANPPQGAWAGRQFPSRFQLARGSTGETYSNDPQPQSLQNYNLNNFVTLSEYVLFPPAEIILINSDLIVDGPTPGLPLNNFITLLGVEYQMPAGRDWTP